MKFTRSFRCLFVVLLTLIPSAARGAPETSPNPVSVVPKPDDRLPTIDDAIKHLDAQPKAAQQLAMWLSDADPALLFLAVRLDRPRELRAAAGGDDVEMKSIGDPSKLIFAASLRQPVWKQGLTNVWVSYPDTKDGKPTRTLVGPRDAHGKFKGTAWRGPDAPAAPDEVETLKGVVSKHHVQSAALGETRLVVVYLPPGYDPKKLLPDSYHGHKPAAIYFGDGGVVESMAPIVEAMILANKIRPVVMIGSTTGDKVIRPPNLPAPTTEPSADDPFARDVRAMEYLSPDPDMASLNPDTMAVHQFMWDRHWKWFTQDLPTWAEQELGVDPQRESRVLSGFSNSAAFVVTVGQKLASRYAGVVANSVAGSRPPKEGAAFENPFADLKDDAPRPKFFLSSGTWETHFCKSTDLWNAFLRERGAETQRLTIVGGHDQAIWELGIANGLPWIVPPRD